MYKTARSVLGNEEDVADSISDTILACWEKIGQLKQDGYQDLMTRILVNRQGHHTEEKAVLSDGRGAQRSRQDKGYEDTEWKEALNMLGERYRLIVMLYYVEGFQTNEISSILGNRRARSGPVWPGRKNWQGITARN